MTKFVLVKLFTIILILFIVCIPEFFKTLKDAYSKEDPYLSLISNISFMCLLQEGQDENTNIVETFITQNLTVSVIILSDCPNSSHAHPELLMCDTERPAHSVQELGTQGTISNRSLEIRGNYLLYHYKDFHFVLVNSEDSPLSVLFTLEIYVTNMVEKEEYATTDYRQFSSPAINLKTQPDTINISLQVNNYVPYYKCALGIIWLVLILFIVVIAFLVFVCNVIQEKKSLTVYYKNTRIVDNSNKEENTLSTNPQHLEHVQHSASKKKQRSYSAYSLSPIPEHGDSSYREMD
ncbi:transmembrane protein 156 isoform 2-T2 [Discoglossus pictus]